MTLEESFIIYQKKEGLGRYKKHTYRELATEYGCSVHNIYQKVKRHRTEIKIKTLEDKVSER